MRKYILVLVLSIILSSCTPSGKEPPKAVRGVLDLRDWDFEKDGIVKLDGDWEIYWQQFLSSKNFDTINEKHYLFVPDNWKGYKWNENFSLPIDGYISYKLKIILNHKHSGLAMKISNMGTAYRFYINDSLYAHNGIAGISKETTKPQYLANLFTIKADVDTLNVIAHVSNFHYHKGGIWFSINFGEENAIRLSRDINLTIEYFFGGTFFIVFVYFIVIFLYMRKDKVSLYWSIFCLLMIFRVLSTGETFITSLFPDMNWELLIKIEIVSYMGGGLVWCLFFYELFKEVFFKYFIKISLFTFLPVIIFSLVTPARIYPIVLPYFQVYTIIVWIYCIVMNYKAIRQKIEGSLLTFISVIIYLFSLINTYLFINNIVNTFDTSVFGLIIFSIIQSIHLSRRFSMAFYRIENFAFEMKKEVNNKTADLKKEKEKTEELLNKSDRLLLNVLPEQIANRLKAGEAPIADHFDEASVVFIDIVDFTKKSANTNPKEIVAILNVLYSKLDVIAKKHNLEKIKTIGDCYMAASGIPIVDKGHANKAAKFAIDAMSALKDYDTGKGTILNFRCGIDCGQVVAGVIGENKFIYDIWGDMVNTASRMETNGIAGRIQCTERFKDALYLTDVKQLIKFEERGEIEIKGKGKMRTYFLISNE